MSTENNGMNNPQVPPAVPDYYSSPQETPLSQPEPEYYSQTDYYPAEASVVPSPGATLPPPGGDYYSEDYFPSPIETASAASLSSPEQAYPEPVYPEQAYSAPAYSPEETTVLPVTTPITPSENASHNSFPSPAPAASADFYSYPGEPAPRQNDSAPRQSIPTWTTPTEDKAGKGLIIANILLGIAVLAVAIGGGVYLGLFSSDSQQGEISITQSNDSSSEDKDSDAKSPRNAKSDSDTKREYNHKSGSSSKDSHELGAKERDTASSDSSNLQTPPDQAETVAEGVKRLNSDSTVPFTTSVRDTVRTRPFSKNENYNIEVYSNPLNRYFSLNCNNPSSKEGWVHCTGNDTRGNVQIWVRP